MIRILATALGVVVAAALSAYAWLGGFSSVAVEEAAFEAREIIFATHRGSYSKVGGTWAAFEKDWQAAGLERCDALSVYLDSTEAAPETLRSVIACDLTGLPDDRRKALRASFPSAVLPAGKALVVRFPYRNPASFFIAPTKAYPAITETIAASGAAPVVGVEVYGPMDAIDEIELMVIVDGERSDWAALYDAF